MVYGYARVSTKEQNLDRQIIDLKKAGVDERYIYFDKASGKNFNRRSWNTLVGTLDTAPVLREGDLLVVSSLDRMGRNYTEIQEQWQYITHELKADIRVIDMPMLDTSKNTDNLDRRFIADLVLQILSYTAQKERENIHKRQEMGIAAAQTKGTVSGRVESNLQGMERRSDYSNGSNGEDGNKADNFLQVGETVRAKRRLKG